jgi:hypothetical protein
VAEVPVNLPGMPRFKHEFQKASGSREMVEDNDGDWVKYEDAVGVLCFIAGYLQSHCAMLEGQGVHPKVIEAVEALRLEVVKL